MPGDSDTPIPPGAPWGQSRKDKVFGKSKKTKAKRPKMPKGKKGPKRDKGGRKR